MPPLLLLLQARDEGVRLVQVGHAFAVPVEGRLGEGIAAVHAEEALNGREGAAVRLLVQHTGNSSPAALGDLHAELELELLHYSVSLAQRRVHGGRIGTHALLTVRVRVVATARGSATRALGVHTPTIKHACVGGGKTRLTLIEGVRYWTKK